MSDRADGTMNKSVADPATTQGNRGENPFRVTSAAIGVLAISLFLGMMAPSIPAPGNGVYTSAVPLSPAGQAGRATYLAEGCAACHTQQVRRIAADAGLGGVTIGDSNQVLGNRRFGPDLAHVGSRLTKAEIQVLLTSSESHGSYRALGTSQLGSLVAYMQESK